MPLFRPSLNSNFLKTRTFFFVSAVVLHIVATLVAAVDVTSDTTKASSSRSAVSSFNLAIHLSSFLIVTFLSILDSLDQESRWRISSVSAEVAFINFVALAQFINAVVFAMLMPKFGCGKASGPDFQPCTTLSRALIALNAMIAALYIIFDVWFTGTAIVASKEDKAVWKSQTRFYPWDGRILPTKASPPLDILGAGATMAQANPRDRLTWANPMHDQGSSSPKLPPPPLPPKSSYPHYTRRTQQALPQDVADATPSSFLRPLSLVSNLPRIQNTPPLRVGNNRPGHLRLHSESSAMSGRYPVISPTHNVSKSEDWLTPGYTYGREYVDQRVVRSALTPSPATSQRIKLPQHPAPTHRRYMSYKEAMDGRYPNKF